MDSYSPPATPGAPAPSAVPPGYGFIRDARNVADSPQQLLQAGYGNVLLNSDDPYALANASKYQAAGIKVGFWVPSYSPGDARNDPAAYAQRMSELSRYNPSTIVPDVEFVGKGYKGSAGWDWSEKMMQHYRSLQPNQALGLTMMPNQADFNYGAYLTRGTNMFFPQSFGASTIHDQMNPQQVYQTLIDAGVPANEIQPLLGPGQKYSGQHSLYALDDINPTMLAQMANQLGGQPTTPNKPQTPLTGNVTAKSPVKPPVTAGSSPVTRSTTSSSLPDRRNPAALAYANQMLARLRKMGYTAKKYGVTGDPTAQYRALSAILGARQAAKAGNSAGYQIRPNTRPEVVNALNRILGRSPAAPQQKVVQKVMYKM